MYVMSEAYTTAAEANARQILVKATFNGTTELTGEHIIDMTVTEATNASGGLSMGATISSKLTMNLKMPEGPLLLTGGYIEPFVGYFGVSDYCPLGKFYITDVVSSDDFKTATITAYDAFSKLEKPYTPTIQMPATAEDILNDIANQYNFNVAYEATDTALPTVENGALTYSEKPTVDDSGILYFAGRQGTDANGVLMPVGGADFPDGTFDLYDFTCRQYIGYFAGLMGKNARFDRKGRLAFVWYADSGYSIDRDSQYMNGFKRLTDADFVIKSISSGSADNMFVAGNGVGITFENPFMTQEILNEIFAPIDTLTYTPAQLKWRGNPQVEAGDIVVADDKDGISRKLLVMEQTLKIGGGMHSEIKCYGESEAAINFDTSPQAKKLQQIYSRLQDAIKEATQLLNGKNGGVFEVTDGNSDGINDGWIIHSADGQRYIKATVDGIGITTDGGATYEQAMTTEGINADAITVGRMSAQRISVGDTSLGDVFAVDTDEDGHPVVTIGSSANDIKQKQTNDAITFVNGADEQIAKFSTTGAEWSDMQEMKYCGFVWTRSGTGNVRFTKARSDE